MNWFIGEYVIPHSMRNPHTQKTWIRASAGTTTFASKSSIVNCPPPYNWTGLHVWLKIYKIVGGIFDVSFGRIRDKKILRFFIFIWRYHRFWSREAGSR